MMWNRARSSSNLNSKAIWKIHSIFQKSAQHDPAVQRQGSDGNVLPLRCQAGGLSLLLPVLTSSSEHSCGRCTWEGNSCVLSDRVLGGECL